MVESLGGLPKVRLFPDELLEELSRFGETFRDYEENEKRLLAAIVPRGWLISPSMAIGCIQQLAQALDKASMEEIDDALVAYFDLPRCQEILDSLYGDPIFAEFQPMLDEALAVHGDGHYRAAVVLWLVAIDGIVRRKFNLAAFSASAKGKRKNHLRQALIERSTFNDGLRDALIEILRRVSLKASDPHVPKRNEILHGNEIDFGNEQASIQLLLVLEVLHYCSEGVGEGEAGVEAA